mmetsp:Transcript_12533/g.30643  ORF Transcript_12533/g.30643 Transcript_12533/m.30643 type:complete len:293 (-) Transcript_12533:238-1116(-)
MLDPLCLLSLLVGLKVTVRHRSVVVVCHVVILPITVVPAVNNCVAVDAGNVPSSRVKLNESVERHVDQRQEEGHAAEWLEEDKEVEGEGRYDGASVADEKGQDGGWQQHPKDKHAPPQQIVIVLCRLVCWRHFGKHHEAAVSCHVNKDAVSVQHKVAKRRPVNVPHVKGISLAGVEPVVEEDVRGGEVVGDIAVQETHPVLPDVADAVTDPWVVRFAALAVPFLMRVRIRCPHAPPAKANPSTVVEQDEPQRKGPVGQLPVEEEGNHAERGCSDKDCLNKVVCVNLLAVDPA